MPRGLEKPPRPATGPRIRPALLQAAAARCLLQPRSAAGRCRRRGKRESPPRIAASPCLRRWLRAAGHRRGPETPPRAAGPPSSLAARCRGLVPPPRAAAGQRHGPEPPPPPHGLPQARASTTRCRCCSPGLQLRPATSPLAGPLTPAPDLFLRLRCSFSGTMLQALEKEKRGRGRGEGRG